MNIQSNSQESLLKDRISKMCSEDTATELYNYLDKLIEQYSLDREKVASGLLEAINSTDVRNIYGFIHRVANDFVTNHLDAFQKKWLEPNFLPLHKAFDELCFRGELWERHLIDTVETHALNEFPIQVSDLVVTNHAIIDYCKERTYSEFLTFLLRSKIMKNCHIPLEQLTREAKEWAAECEKLYADLG